MAACFRGGLTVFAPDAFDVVRERKLGIHHGNHSRVPAQMCDDDVCSVDTYYTFNTCDGAESTRGATGPVGPCPPRLGHACILETCSQNPKFPPKRKMPPLGALGIPVPKLHNGKYTVDPFDSLRHQNAVTAVQSVTNYTNTKPRLLTRQRLFGPSQPISGTPSTTKVRLGCCSTPGSGGLDDKPPARRFQVSTNSAVFVNATRACNGARPAPYLGGFLLPGSSLM